MSPRVQLTGQEEEWLLRAATWSGCGVMPASAVAALVAAGLGEETARGTLDINDAGRYYLSLKKLSPALESVWQGNVSAVPERT